MSRLPVICPKCGSSGRIKNQERKSDDLGCAVFALGGLLPYLLLAASEQDRFVCLDCGHHFRTPVEPWSGTAKALGWAGALLTLPPVAAFVAFSYGVEEQIEDFFEVDWFASLAASFPGVIFAILIAQLILFAIYCVILIPISNGRYRRSLREDREKKRACKAKNKTSK